ncbi:YjbE family integral membrane protein [Ottowia thiooxydans]|uniref:YjbE family integral membrane protein n=1 Tax=Ottowia thiooxydans TaxID=219182 RepID=A0ABV2Q9C6_9BURK
MEFLSAPWWSALLAIILIDLVLAGDNAIVIALAARNVPKHLQQKAIVWGTVGAIIVRTTMTLVVVWLLKVPGLMLVGGLGLLWIAYKLVAAQEGGEDEHGPAASTFWGAMKTIVVADALMGIDNVLGVAGAAHGAMDLVVIGLLISVPIMVFGSTMVLKLVDRFPAIIYIGAGVLAYTAGSMLVGERLLARWFGTDEAPVTWVRWAVIASCIVLVLGGAWLSNRKSKGERTAAIAPTDGHTHPIAAEALAAISAPVGPVHSHLKKESSMETVILYVDDAAYAAEFLARQQSAPAGKAIEGPRNWIVMGCAPKLTRHASQWTSPEARKQRREDWMAEALSALRPVLQADGSTVEGRLATLPLLDVTRSLRLENRALMVLDGRRPKAGIDLEPVAPELTPAKSGWAMHGAAASMGTLLILVNELAE